ncbi:MAG: protease modulator HflC [Chitinispirillaceae bacterium]
MRSIIVSIFVAVLLITGLSSVYTVDETQQVVITQFGEAIGEPVTEPGLRFKTPWLQKVNYFPKNLLEWDGQPGQVPTREKTFIWVDTFGRWRIVDPLTYFEKVNNETSAQANLDGIIDAAVRNLVTSNYLIETVRSSNRELGKMDDSVQLADVVIPKKLRIGRRQMAEAVQKQAANKLSEFGIELVDVQFKRINYNERVLEDVYNRMIAERRQIAEMYRSEGRGESSKIEGEKEKELKRIYSQAYAEAEKLKGEADAGATRTYAAAYGQDPEFYSFVKTLELYRSSLDSSTSAILSTQSDFMKYFKEYRPKN